MTFASPVRLALVLSAGALTLSACGSSYADTKPAQVQKDVEKAMGGLTSVHVEGKMDEGGETGDISLSVNKDGDCEGDITIDEVGSFKLLSTNGTAFFKPDASFWEAQAGPQGAQIAQVVGDKWVVATEGMEELASMCNLDEIVNSIEEDIDKDFKVGEAAEVDGEDTVTVTFTSKDGNKGTGHVLTSDPHYLLDSDVKDEGDIALSKFNEKVEPEAPADEDVIDLSQLAG